MQKIHSGSFIYLAKISRRLYKEGYRLVRSKHWADNNWTYVFER